MSSDDERLSEREQLARVIRAITDLWDSGFDGGSCALNAPLGTALRTQDGER